VSPGRHGWMPTRYFLEAGGAHTLRAGLDPRRSAGERHDAAVLVLLMRPAYTRRRRGASLPKVR